jgi:NADPH:quinone reductase-like Zn-dependent oxidoreductase
MRAAAYHRYGPPDVVQIEEVPKPVPKDDEVSIQVRAASVNPLDFHFMRGSPGMVRMVTGLRRPKFPILGVDVAGIVEASGKDVRQFKPGDEVFGSCRGAFAECACTSESTLATKPSNVTFEQAAAVPVAAYSALQALRDCGKIQAGQKVLINGAAGGVGTFAVQLAKWFGAEVTGVCSTRNADMVRSIGADWVIDYTREDYTESGLHYDILCDCVGNHSLSENRRALNPKGVHIPVGGKGDIFLGPLLQKLVLAPFYSQKMTALFMARNSKEDLVIMSELTKTGKVTPVIDRRYDLADTRDALAYLEQGHARGKVVITMN